MNYTLHQLKVFYTVSNCGSYTKAAQQLGLQQPTVSEQVSTLEKTFGLDLIERIHGGLRLTDAGKVLYQSVQHVLGVSDDLGRIVEQLRGQSTGTVRVCADTTVGTSAIPDVISKFQRLHSGIQIILEVVNRAKVIERLEEGKVDLAVMGRPPDLRGLEVEIFLPNELLMVASVRHRLAYQLKLPLSAISDERFLVRESGSGTRTALIELLETVGIKPKIAMVLSHNEAIKQAVIADLGIALMSRNVLEQELKLGLMTILDLEGLPIIRRWHVVSPPGKLVSPATREFRQFLKNYQPNSK
ncbi:MAG: LysR family transcriptional regulator [Chloroflexi bacterium]|uniref:LysR family transcriptional regulator n=1 Tax=Candidatus Chlorohelix allophototropha TaxID=3003348 RepID=A0A8T7LZJ9_9CHLR|nr:LysR family transcriptional regulator [Chloroflexota bacterium]WJW66303.1 LysR family transcriptional regulator [Chloroflexota bacterium L227-S17]